MSHAVESLGDLFFLPGNYVLSVLLTVAPGVARLLGIGPEDYSGVPAGVLSAVIWLVLIVVLGAVYEQVRAADRALTAYIQHRYEAALHRGRVLRTWLVSRVRRLKHRSRPRRAAVTEQTETHDLDALEVAALKSHAALGPGYMLTATDLSHALGIPAFEVKRTLYKLDRLRLLERSLGARDQEEGYTLSDLGKAFLRSRGVN